MTELDLAVLDQRIADAQDDEIAAKSDAERAEGRPAGGRFKARQGSVLALDHMRLTPATGTTLRGLGGICYKWHAKQPGFRREETNMAVNPSTSRAGPWTIVHWSLFDPSKVDPTLLAAVKAAALVEYNAPDYVTYLKRVFRERPPSTLACHRAVGRRKRASMAGPWGAGRRSPIPVSRWRKPSPVSARAIPRPISRRQQDGSVRGSRRGEMIARCVVESGTSSYYSAIRDATEEPVLKEIAGRIAADEYRHYKLFYETLHTQNEPDLGVLEKLWIGDGPGARKR